MLGYVYIWLVMVFWFAVPGGRCRPAPLDQESAILKALESLDEHQLGGIETLLGLGENTDRRQLSSDSLTSADVMLGDMPVQDGSSWQLPTPGSLDDIVKSDRERSAIDINIFYLIINCFV